ncbi:hypothetical protein AB9T89_18685 [Flavobacterium oncorhynchi]|uniref:hypothetical protein n=1 Tax=Flavobacterium oncorhynchi TaxID=728056 RepID=UPI003519E8D5
MNKIFYALVITTFFVISLNAQSLTELQMQNARATGYAIVAARNPGKSFSIYMIKWDGINSLEYNANKINPSWHPQAVVKGNYFNQTFDGNDFTNYSSVIVSQSEFDVYKSTGTDWWIVCSTLPAFSNSGFSISDYGNIGIGTSNPSTKLSVLGNISKLTLVGTDGVYDNFIKYGHQSDLESGTTSVNRWHGIDATITAGGASENKLKFKLYGGSFANLVPNDVMTLVGNGNVGIGTTSPQNKLDVNGTIHSKEVKVDMNGWSDFVFKKEYNLPTLEEVEKHIVEKGHLENIPSEEEVLKDGISLGEMNSKLLQKIEELTLYMIEQEKKTKQLKTFISDQNKIISEQNKRLEKLENKQ